MRPASRDGDIAQIASVVIPCFNAKRWIAEAIDSCLFQTYRNVEVIVVDDGSTDESATVVEEYGDRVRLIRQANSGGCAARNVGFAAATGDYIQFLDADDYLYPVKLERQIALMQSENCDAVYGDWQHQHHDVDGRIWKQEPAVSGVQDNVVESLLSGWWVSPAAVLYHRRIVERIGGWDESLAAAQDRDFFTRVAIETKLIKYSAGCDAVYRRYGNVTVGTGNPRRFIDNHLRVIEKAEQTLREREELFVNYRKALARSYFYIARNMLAYDPQRTASLVERIQELDTSFRPSQNSIYDFIYRWFGFQAAEAAANLKRRVLK